MRLQYCDAKTRISELENNSVQIYEDFHTWSTDLRCTTCGMGNQKRARICIVKHKFMGLFEMAPLSSTREKAMAKILASYFHPEEGRKN